MTTFFAGVLIGLLCGFVFRSIFFSAGPSPPEPKPEPSRISIDIEDIKEDPELVEVIESQPAVSVESVPEEVSKAVQDEIQSAPTVAAAVEIASKFIRDPDVAKIVVEVTRWRPRRCNSETQYQNSFLRHLRKIGYLEGEIAEKQRITWGGDHGARRTAIPDLILGKRVLVELKADLTASGETDRAMGQMLRYLLAWKGKGPSILVVCGDISPEIRFLVRMYTTTWRKTVNLPVTVLFRRFPAGTEAEMPTDDPLLESTF